MLGSDFTVTFRVTLGLGYGLGLGLGSDCGATVRLGFRYRV